MSRGAWHIAVAIYVVIAAWNAAPVEAQQPAADREMERIAERLLSEAKDRIKSGSHWQAARDLALVLDYYPEYKRIDEVLLLLGGCLYEMELYNAAAATYTYLVKNYFGSPLLAKGLLGLQKTAYKQGKYQESLHLYEAILQAPRPVDVDDEARYYAGQSYYNIKDYASALEALLNLDPRSDYYGYGLYTVGLSLLKMKRVTKSVAVFRKLVSLPIVSEERRAIVDEGRLTLGYLYYELGYYKEARGYFAAVSPEHRRYPEALLARGWASVKMGDYEGAVRPLVTLVSRHPQDPKTEEALFLLGRCYLQLGLFDDAVKVYDKIIELFPEEDNLSTLVQQLTDLLGAQEKEVERLREDLLLLEASLLDAMHVGGGPRLPPYLKEEKARLDETRRALLESIVEEHRRFLEMHATIAALRENLSLKMERKSWRAYAEYGKSRALFLKGTAGGAQGRPGGPEH
ncbi:MAG: tetratricopeptide repeat protein [candidate division KSB1 bacterium]|nr:tetratricopeptide repeat protein [candidate division KSB1 bacterium]